MEDEKKVEIEEISFLKKLLKGLSKDEVKLSDEKTLKKNREFAENARKKKLEKHHNEFLE